MKQKDYITFSAIVFILVALFHSLRVLLGWSMVVAGWPVPAWISHTTVVMAIYLAYSASKLSK